MDMKGLCGVCGRQLVVTRYACAPCWDGLTVTQRMKLMEDMEKGEKTMAKEKSKPEGVDVSAITDEMVRDKFKLTEDDFTKLPKMCQMALKEAMTSGGGLSSLYIIYARDADGERYDLLVSAPDGSRAIDRFMSYNDFDYDYDWEDEPVAYRLPTSHPFGIVQMGRLEQHALRDNR